MGVAGAVAFAGLMSAGVQTAQAELVVKYQGASGPVSVSNVDQWTYNYSLSTGSISNGYASIAQNDYFVLVGFDGYVSTNIGSDWTVSEINSSSSGLPSSLTYPNSGTIETKAANGSIAAASTIPGISDLLFTYNTSSPSTIYSPLSFSVISTVGTTLPSVELGNYSADSTVSSNGILVPDTSSTPAGPLPLPAAFWPGLLTLSGMAVVGGLRLRRRTV